MNKTPDTWSQFLHKFYPITQELQFILMKSIPRGKGTLKVLDKKLEGIAYVNPGDKIYYLLAKGRWRRWIDF